MDPFCDPRGNGTGVVVHHNYREFVPADAGNEVVGAHATLEARGQLDEQVIAALMTQRVIDILEVVDVDE
jgi:hypothetical protein